MRRLQQKFGIFRPAWPLLIACGWITFLASAHGAMDVFLKLDGIEGESRDKAHANEIDVLAWSWGMSRPALTSNTGAISGPLSFTDLSITKYVDKATPSLMLNCSKGRFIPNALLTCRVQTTSNAVEFYKFQASRVLVTGLNEGGSTGEDLLTETVTLAFESLVIDYYLIDRTGTKDYFFEWNLAENVGRGGLRGAPNGDTDGDGMPDTYETANGLNINVNDANLDKDGDGMSNLNEYLAGTSAANANSVFKATLSYTRGSPNAQLSWPSVAGQQYTVYYTDSLGTAMSTLGNYTASNTVTQITVPANLARRFLRVQVKPAP